MNPKLKLEPLVRERVARQQSFTVRELTELVSMTWQDVERELRTIEELSSWQRSWTRAKGRKTVLYHPPEVRPSEARKGLFRRSERKPIVHRPTLTIPARTCREAGFVRGEAVLAFAAGRTVTLTRARRSEPPDGVYTVDSYDRLTLTPATLGLEGEAWTWSVSSGTVTVRPAGEAEAPADVARGHDVAPTVELPANIVKSAGWRKGQTVWAWTESNDDELVIVVRRAVRPPNERAVEYTVNSYNRVQMTPSHVEAGLPADGWTAQAYDYRVELRRPR